jgi:hypothetical protein
MEIYFWDWGEMGYRFRGLRLLTANLMTCLEAGVTQSAGSKVIKKKLGTGERIVGVISRQHKEHIGVHYDVQFKITTIPTPISNIKFN